METFRSDRNIRHILLATHSALPDHPFIKRELTKMLTRAAVKLAFDFNVHIFRSNPILEHKGSEYLGYLKDTVHQIRDASILLTKDLHSFLND